LLLALKLDQLMLALLKLCIEVLEWTS